MKAILERLIELADHFDRLDKDPLRDGEQLQTTFLQATPFSTQTVSDERQLRQTTVPGLNGMRNGSHQMFKDAYAGSLSFAAATLSSDSLDS
jgi:hypothetical protein